MLVRQCYERNLNGLGFSAQLHTLQCIFSGWGQF
jgi:hypothetical protein